MTDEEYSRKLDELDRLLNDPDVPMQPARIWSLLGELSRRDGQTAAATQTVQASGPAFGFQPHPLSGVGD